MAKTLVVSNHEPGPAVNGFDGCQARAGNGGFCPGVELADWLNGMGEDEETYITLHGDIVTNGMVRDRWLRNNHHIVAREPALASLRANERRLSAELRLLKREIKRVEAA